MPKKIIFHIDANSAFLSWSAVERLRLGLLPDLRDIPSVVGGDEQARKGIVLAKSIPAKSYRITTGEPLFSARRKCPGLVVVPPNFKLYQMLSNKMLAVCNRFSPALQKFSIDELFLDYTNMEMHFGSPLEGAEKIRQAIKNELGFTVNIGISTNKLLAKMASDFQKPDKIHTLYPDEIERKMWPLAVEDLFMVGRKTKEHLMAKGICTIGDLAHADPKLLKYYFKSHGYMLWCFANGIESSDIIPKELAPPVKSIGNSTTLPKDAYSEEEVSNALLALCEQVCIRLRNQNFHTKLITVHYTAKQLSHYSHQRKLIAAINATMDVYTISKELFHALWKGEPVRAVGICLSCLCEDFNLQSSWFDSPLHTKHQRIDLAVDNIRKSHGDLKIVRGSLLKAPEALKITGRHAPSMSSIL